MIEVEPLNVVEMARAHMLKERGCLPAQDDAVWELPTDVNPLHNDRLQALGRILERHELGDVADLEWLFRPNDPDVVQPEAVAFDSWDDVPNPPPAVFTIVERRRRYTPTEK